jgi:hypothetical protein
VAEQACGDELRVVGLEPPGVREQPGDRRATAKPLPRAGNVGRGVDDGEGEGEVCNWPAGHTAFVEDDVVFTEVGPVGATRQFGDHAEQVLGRT